jgi:predicted nuclease with TOPRIM domain
MQKLKWILLVVGILSIGYTIYSYFSLNEKYLEYKNQVDETVKLNEQLTKDNNSLLLSVEEKNKEKAKLLLELTKKQEIITQQEKLIYENGQLIIPLDYESLKNNYTILNSLYLEQKTIIATQYTQMDEDQKTIIDLSNSLKNTMDMNAELERLLLININKPIPFLQHSFLAGVGASLETKSVSIEYLATIKDKFQAGLILTYPPEVSVLIGVKL